MNEEFPDFPTTDEFVDFAGRTRRFTVKLDRLPMGYSVLAVEDVRGDDRYEFRAFSLVNPFQALGDLRKRIPKLLSIRHLVKQNGKWLPTHDRLRGRIDYKGVVVDGVFLTFEELAEIVQTYEGFQFDLRFVDPSDDLE